MQWPVVLETSDFCVLNKPCGLGMHQESGSPGLVQRFREARGHDFFPVHRLDKVTSGALLLAKSPEANAELSRQFRERQVVKYYLALSARTPNKKQGRVMGDMTRARNGGWKLVRSCENPAITHFFSRGLGTGLRLFIIRPATGKTHQVRVALKSLGAPILGDELYGGEHADRVYLHAWGLEFSLRDKDYSVFIPPQSGGQFLDAAFMTLLQEIGHPGGLAWPGSRPGRQA